MPDSAEHIETPAIPSPLRTDPALHTVPRRRRWLYYVLPGLALLLFGLAGGGFFVVTALEEHDTFCISCHLAPEITYFNRAYIALDHPEEVPADLSSAHYLAAQAAGDVPFRCIDCHRGDARLPHRVAAVALGARDTLIYALGRENPAIEKHRTQAGWLANASCSTCHGETLLRLDGINNHFHTYLPEATVALERGGQIAFGDALRQVLADTPNPDPALTSLHPVAVEIFCSDCHQPHHALLDGPQTFFMREDLRNETCITCHVAAGQGPQSLQDLVGN